MSPPLSYDHLTCAQHVSSCGDKEDDKNIMIRNLSRIILLLLCFCYLSMSKDVNQDPPAIVGSPQNPATINCSHSISGYLVILWYQKPIGDSTLKLIGYIQYTTPVVEEDFKDNFRTFLQPDRIISFVCFFTKIMFKLCIHLVALHFCLTDNASKNNVHQTPAVVIKRPEESVQINCKHSNTNFNMIQWYKQPSGKTDMSLLGYTRFTNSVVEDPFKSLYNVTGNGQSQTSLLISKLRQSDYSGVYFCAASEAQCCMKLPASTKTLSDKEGTIIHLLITI
ncbi:uncharacterized protein LOC124855671 [Girardinichthys multiradiatus]|uniref:uncharacterized protein LOC124855671 n=1 Tax=Girardinichthys multiradiatus TaxID=208333 RepID=UPI001FAC4135|nr:uncharacterized protein LOC124855671 [Girardinichthys multiradiatus]